MKGKLHGQNLSLKFESEKLEVGNYFWRLYLENKRKDAFSAKVFEQDFV